MTPCAADDADPGRVRAERDLYRRLLDLGEHADAETLLSEALALLAETAGARTGYVEIADPMAGGAVRFTAAHGLPGEVVERVRATISRGILSDTLATGRTVQTASAVDDPRFRERRSVQAMRIESVLCVPIGGPPPVGVAYLQGRESQAPFDDGDVARAELVARHLAPYAERLILRHRTGDEGDATAEVRRAFPAPGLVGRSRALARALRDAATVAPRDINVLVTGETGTGKSALAHALWAAGPRSGGPFVALNCAAIPPALVEQELFGAAAGAHSTAVRRIEGKARAADRGVLFLDEVCDLPHEAQSKLLQLVEHKSYYPLGSAEPERADVRVIAATNVDPAAAIRDRRLRADLYFRLASFPIRMPSLAERTGDVPILARHFTETYGAAHGRPDLELSEGALLVVWSATWPGNVRELASRIEAAVLRAAHEGAPRVTRRHVFPEREPDDPPEHPPTWHEAQQRFQRRFLEEALSACGGNVTEAARRLDLARSHLYSLLQAHGLRGAAGNGC